MTTLKEKIVIAAADVAACRSALSTAESTLDTLLEQAGIRGGARAELKPTPISKRAAPEPKPATSNAEQRAFAKRGVHRKVREGGKSIADKLVDALREAGTSLAASELVNRTHEKQGSVYATLSKLVQTGKITRVEDQPGHFKVAA